MKNFLRSIAGKILLYIICTIGTLVFISSCIGWLAAEAELDSIEANIYMDTEEEIAQKEILDRVYPEAYNALQDLLYNGYATYKIQMEYEVRAKNAKVIFKSLNPVDENAQYVFPFKLTKGTEYEYGFTESEEDSSIIIHNEIMYRYYDLILDEIPVDADYVFTCSVTPFTYLEETVTATKNIVHLAYALRYAIYVIAFAALVLAIISFILILCVAARKPGREDIIPGALNKVPFDVLLAIYVIGAVFVFNMFDSWFGFMRSKPELIFAYFIVLAAIPLLLGLAMSIAARVKQRNLLKNTVIWRVIAFLIRCIKWLVKNLPLAWKAALVVAAICLIEFIATMASILRYNPDGYVAFFILEKLVIVGLAIYATACFIKIKKGGEALAAGNLDYKIETEKMVGDIRKHADNMNRIGEGMAKAVDEKLKSERMKTQLITNVSHDIKTPLTSIINYASLTAENVEDKEKVKEYSEVLVRQSEKLKRLLEDLVEASKASTGNLDVSMAPCDAAVFIEQAAGEYEDKLKAAQLTLIAKLPEKQVKIMADGRRMWRVFDNLMNNICKYAQAGTRVYLSLEEKGDSAVITFKNTSREALNMSEEELMERFTRGDASRGTEGNGLGLSIAKSMAELQNGSLTVSIDGDLFKATLDFPVIKDIV